MSKSKSNGNTVQSPSLGRPRGGTVVNLKQLIQAMHEVSRAGGEDRQENIDAVAKKLGVKPNTVLTKIREARYRVPQIRLLDLNKFLRKPGYPEISYSDDDLNELFSELLGEPVEQVQEAVEQARTELETELANRKPRGRKPKAKQTDQVLAVDIS